MYKIQCQYGQLVKIKVLSAKNLFTWFDFLVRSKITITQFCMLKICAMFCLTIKIKQSKSSKKSKGGNNMYLYELLFSNITEVHFIGLFVTQVPRTTPIH